MTAAQTLLASRDHAEIEDFARWLAAASDVFCVGAALARRGTPAAAFETDPAAFRFPRPLLHEAHLELSFSGLKSSVIRTIERLEAAGEPVPVEDLCASFQQAVVDVLVAKTLRAAETEGIGTITLAGGVALNRQLRAELQKAGAERGYRTFAPRPGLCVDNGAMVAGAAYHLYHHRGPSGLGIDAVANAPLGTLAVRYKHGSKYR